LNCVIVFWAFLAFWALKRRGVLMELYSDYVIVRVLKKEPKLSKVKIFGDLYLLEGHGCCCLLLAARLLDKNFTVT
jgi:hypothetical protein